MTKKITSPLAPETIMDLKAGDIIALSGVIYTARDAAHKRLTGLIERGEHLPFDIRGQTVYYAGPCPAPPGRPIGSVGPTTSARMDVYAPLLMREGFRVMIGKGLRNPSVIEAIRGYSGVYFAAVGGAGALLSLTVESVETGAFSDLGPEAVYKLTVREMPLVTAIDCNGGNIYIMAQ